MCPKVYRLAMDTVTLLILLACFHRPRKSRKRCTWKVNGSMVHLCRVYEWCIHKECFQNSCMSASRTAMSGSVVRPVLLSDVIVDISGDLAMRFAARTKGNAAIEICAMIRSWKTRLCVPLPDVCLLASVGAVHADHCSSEAKVRWVHPP